MRMRYREQSVFAQMNLLDSHDVSRFSSLCGGDEEAYELAVLFLMTFPGMPSVFYGDELGVTGLCEDDYRQAMPWERAAVSKAADTGYSRQQLFIKSDTSAAAGGGIAARRLWGSQCGVRQQAVCLPAFSGG